MVFVTESFSDLLWKEWLFHNFWYRRAFQVFEDYITFRFSRQYFPCLLGTEQLFKVLEGYKLICMSSLLEQESLFCYGQKSFFLGFSDLLRKECLFHNCWDRRALQDFEVFFRHFRIKESFFSFPDKLELFKPSRIEELIEVFCKRKIVFHGLCNRKLSRSLVERRPFS